MKPVGSVCRSLNSALTQPRPTQRTHVYVFQDYASEGLRTLMVAYRELDEAFFQDWSKRHNEACLSLENRESRLSSIYEEVEKDLMVSEEARDRLGAVMGPGSQQTEQGL